MIWSLAPMVRARLSPTRIPLGWFDRLGRQDLADVLQAEADPAERHRIDLDADGRLLATADEHLSDPLHLRDLLGEDGVGLVVDLGERERVRRGRQDEDGSVRGVDLPERGPRGQVRRSSPPAAAMAAWTSRPAASTSRSRSNWRVSEVCPKALVEVISVMPAMRPNRRSSGVATDDAMRLRAGAGERGSDVDGRHVDLGQAARRAGRSTPRNPDRRIATARSDVAIGLWMNGAEMFIRRYQGSWRSGRRRGSA